MDYFLSENMLGYFSKILENPLNLLGDVPRQVLQTLCLLIQNIRNTETVYCLFSNNHLNRILSIEFEFDEELLGLYVNVLRAISLKLDQHSAEFFVVRDVESSKMTFVLYSKALKFGGCNDSMVRAAVRNITLSSFSIQSISVQECFIHDDTKIYFRSLSDDVIQSCFSLDALLSDDSSDPLHIEQVLSSIDDDFIYFNEVYSMKVPVVSLVAFRAFWKDILLDLCVCCLARNQARPKKNEKRIRPATALLILETYINSVSNKELVSLLVSILLAGDALEMGNNVKQGLTEGSGLTEAPLRISDIITSDDPCEILKIRNNLMYYLQHGELHIVSGILRLLACILWNENVSHDLLRTVGLIPYAPPITVGTYHQDEISDTKDLRSFPIEGNEVLESASSACLSERYGEVLEAIFAGIKSPYCSPLIIMVTIKILTKMIDLRGECVRNMLNAYKFDLKYLLKAYQDDVFSKVIRATDWVDCVPLLLKHYWTEQFDITSKALILSSRMSIASWKLTDVLLRLASTRRDDSRHAGLNLCLLTVMGFVSRLQIYQLIERGIIDSLCPFQGPSWVNLIGMEVKKGDLVDAPSGAFHINSGQSILKIWTASGIQCTWYDQIISLVVLQKYADTIRYTATAVAPIVAANVQSLDDRTTSFSVRVEVSTLLKSTRRFFLGLHYDSIDETLVGNQIKISFASTEECEFFQKLVHEIVEDLRDRCLQHVAALIPP